MPHLVILYTPQLGTETDIDGLCRTLAGTMQACRDDDDKPVFPVAGIRVLAYPAAHFAVADSSGDFGFIYFNLRMARGRSSAVQQRVGAGLEAAARAHLAPLLARRLVGLTLQVDEGPELFDAKFGNLHSHIGKAR
jgi:5-carboxymethyl-2-hydroxymuconate isomerase